MGGACATRPRHAPQVQLYILRGMGERLPDAAWRTFLESPLASFESLAPEVQVEAIRLCEKAPARFSHRRLLDFVRHCLDYEESPPARGAGLTRAEVAAREPATTEPCPGHGHDVSGARPVGG